MACASPSRSHVSLSENCLGRASGRVRRCGDHHQHDRRDRPFCPSTVLTTRIRCNASSKRRPSALMSRSTCVEPRSSAACGLCYRAGLPSGSTITYAALASRIGERDAVRAVARACAQNAIALGILCHRVIRRHAQVIAGVSSGSAHCSRERARNESQKTLRVMPKAARPDLNLTACLDEALGRSAKIGHTNAVVYALQSGKCELP
jgi:O-6-methylguanine DNA methyltransferase